MAHICNPSAGETALGLFRTLSWALKREFVGTTPAWILTDGKCHNLLVSNEEAVWEITWTHILLEGT